jgi:hypothetical protein
MVRSTIPPHLALESFDPKLKLLLERGATQRIIIYGDVSEDRSIPLEERQRAALKKLRYMANRLNALRNTMLKLEDERARLLYRTVVRVDPDDLTLTVEPRDAQLGSLLAQIPDSLSSEETSTLDELTSILENREEN